MIYIIVHLIKLLDSKKSGAVQLLVRTSLRILNKTFEKS